MNESERIKLLGRIKSLEYLVINYNEVYTDCANVLSKACHSEAIAHIGAAASLKVQARNLGVDIK